LDDDNRIGGVMVIVLVASGVVDCGFEPWSGQTKNYEIGISRSTQH
jgi:hypothetical protein